MLPSLLRTAFEPARPEGQNGVTTTETSLEHREEQTKHRMLVVKTTPDIYSAPERECLQSDWLRRGLSCPRNYRNFVTSLTS